MQIRLSFQEVFDLITKPLKQSTGTETIKSVRFVVEENQGAQIVERTPKEQFSALYVELE